MVSPAQKRQAVRGVVAAGLCSQRRACRYLGLHRSSGRYREKAPSDWLLRLHRQVETLSRKHPRLGYRKLTRMLRSEGWKVGKKLVQRLRRESGLRVKRWRPRPRRRGKSTGTIPTRAERLNHVWSWDFVADRTPSILDQTTDELSSLLGDVRKQAPRARVLLVGYPRIAPPSGTCDALGIAAGDVMSVLKAETELEAALRRAAASADVDYVSLRGPSVGHHACAGDQAWTNGVSPAAGDGIVFHPNARGMAAVADVVAAAVR